MKAARETYRCWKYLGLLTVVFSFLWVCQPVYSAEKSGSSSNGKGGKSGTAQKAKNDSLIKEKGGIPLNLNSGSPLNIAGDRMEANQKDREIIFEGHVVVQQSDLTITGRTLKVYAVAGDKPNQDSMMDKIDRIEVEGDVRISQREKLATAEKAVYYHQESKIVLMGNPSVSQGQDKLMGRLITLYINEGRSVVEGGAETPVQAVLHPSRKD
jgi:lipopolysaccharide export system protein LptA